MRANGLEERGWGQRSVAPGRAAKIENVGPGSAGASRACLPLGVRELRDDAFIVNISSLLLAPGPPDSGGSSNSLWRGTSFCLLTGATCLTPLAALGPGTE